MNEIYNGESSIILSRRPYFSIIIACYNSKNTLKNLLESIKLQDMNDDIEVILSDDCSTESYQDIVDEYKSILSIRQVQTDYNFAPGNTREKGLSIAEGEWIMFADHDDEFIIGTLKKVKEKLLESGEEYYAISNFLEVNPDTKKVISKMEGTRNWNHAKFYNLDNLIKTFDIHFAKDLLTHEDIYISTRVNCALRAINREPLMIDMYTYIWNSRPTSISRERYGDHPFLEIFFKDYIYSTGQTYIDMYEDNWIDIIYAIHSSIEVLLYCYFYMQGFMFHSKEKYIIDNEEYSRRYLINIKKAFKLDNQYILDYVSLNDAFMYTNIRKAASIAAGPYIESYTFKQWMDYLHEDIKPRITMSDSMHK